jgi:NIMA (never in mitosis gene a)-related kinase
MDEKILNSVDEPNPEFMKTIIIPKNLHYLTERLPEPNYQPLKLKKIDKHNFL